MLGVMRRAVLHLAAAVFLPASWPEMTRLPDEGIQCFDGGVAGVAIASIGGMSDPEILEILRKWIVEQVLDASVGTIEPDAPLLEWGVLNSLSTNRLVGFIRDQFGIDVPPESLVGANFKDLNSITALVVRLRAADGR